MMISSYFNGFHCSFIESVCRYLRNQPINIFIRNRVQREKEVKKNLSNARTQRNFNIHIIFHGMITEADRMIFIHYIILKSIVRGKETI